MARVVLKNVSGGALRELHLEIGDREFVVVAGPAGSGKTTLLRLLAGLEEIGSGEIFLDDKKMNGVKAGAREIAMVFSEDALYPAMTLRENIAFGLRLRKFSATESSRRIDDAATALEVRDILDRRPREVSDWQRQRVALARAIARQPKVLLLDEPMERFDAGTRARLRADLRRLHERLETTIIYATRDAADALALGERIVVLHEGRVEQSDTRAAVYDTPANMFVGEFLGAPPMNFIHGTLKLERDALLFREAGEGTLEVRFPLAAGGTAGDPAGNSVVLGIRPEDVEIVHATRGEEPAHSFPALIDFVETTGAETTLHLQTGGHTIVVRGAGRALALPAGRRARAQFDPRKAHLFDPMTTRRLTGS